MLAHDAVIPYLIDRGLISRKTALDRNISVVGVGSRNNNFKVVCEAGRSFFVKQAVGSDRIATVRREAEFYEWLWSSRSRAALQAHVPRYYGYDPESCALVLRMVSGAVDGDEARLRDRALFPMRFGTPVGDALGLFHTAPTGGRGAAPVLHDAPSTIPWAFAIHRPDPDFFRTCSAAHVQLIRLIQKDRAFCDGLDRLRRAWQPGALVHFDVDWKNILFVSARGRAKGGPILFVDWELAGLGDARWDVACVFSAFLDSWVQSIPMASVSAPEPVLSHAGLPLERVQPAIRAFWNAYTRRAGAGMGDRGEFLVGAVRHAAARLVQTASEYMQQCAELSRHAVCLLQLGANLMRRPEEAAVHLLGLSIDRPTQP